MITINMLLILKIILITITILWLILGLIHAIKWKFIDKSTNPCSHVALWIIIWPMAYIYGP